MIYVLELDTGLYDVTDIDTQEKIEGVPLNELPELLDRLGVLPGEWEESRRPLTHRENELLISICTTLWMELEQVQARRKGAEYIRRTMIPSKKPNRLSLTYWKHEIEGAIHHYVSLETAALAFQDAGIRVMDERIYAREISDSV